MRALPTVCLGRPLVTSQAPARGQAGASPWEQERSFGRSLGRPRAPSQQPPATSRSPGWELPVLWGPPQSPPSSPPCRERPSRSPHCWGPVAPRASWTPLLPRSLLTPGAAENTPPPRVLSRSRQAPRPTHCLVCGSTWSDRPSQAFPRSQRSRLLHRLRHEISGQASHRVACIRHYCIVSPLSDHNASSLT